MARGEVTFLVGAGVSADPPSCLPLAAGLVEHLVAPLTAQAGLPPALRMACRSAIVRLRPEVVADVLTECIGPGALLPIARALDGPPNRWHRGLAEAIGRGCSVVTTNFDTLIESTCESCKIPFRLVVEGADRLASRGASASTLLKVHGSLPRGRIGDSADLATLAFALRQVSQALTPGIRDVLDSLLRDRPLVVIGYAGRDDFDIRQYLAGLGRTAPTLWVVHDDSEDDLRPITPQDRAWSPAVPALEHQAQWKGPTTVLRGPTRGLLSLCPEPRGRAVALQSFQPRSLPTTVVEPLASARALAYLLLEVRDCKLGVRVLRRMRSRIPKETEAVVRLTIDEAVLLEKEARDLRAAARIAAEAHRSALRIRNRLVLVEALDQRGVVARKRGYYAIADRHYRAALRRVRAGDPEQLLIKIRSHRAVTLEYLGSAFERKGSTAAARRAYRRAMAYYEQVREHERRCGDLRGTGKTLNNMGILLASMRKPSQADEKFRESISLKELTGDVQGVAASYHGLGRLHYYQGDQAVALESFEMAYRLRSGPAMDSHGAAQALIGIGRIALRGGDKARALRCGRESLARMLAVGDQTGVRLARELIRDATRR